MEFVTITLISIGLAMDALAVSLGIGTAGQIPSLRGKIRLAAHFGIFQSGMTALGWLAGGTIVQYVSGFDHWIAFALLGYVGINLVRAGFNKNGEAFEQDPSTGKVLVMLSFATSIDAFAVGLSIVFLKVPILLSVIAIGLVTLMLSALGLFAGAKLGETFGKRMEIFGGLILLGIGTRVVLTHLFP
ncbi:MAG: manganese efflux pump MntP family protein [Chloroflexi bacterium]|nr:manganese efflux pump MntP family protein [Chloroflexota bacterium]